MLKNSTLTNNKKEVDVTKNEKNFLAPRIQSPESRRPGPKRLVVQSPSVKASRVQASWRLESKRPNYASRVQRFRYASNGILPLSKETL